jgi:pimeloyl-ACP methyl ester carboxylesterase
MHGVGRNASEYRDSISMECRNEFARLAIILVVPCFSNKRFPRSTGYALGNVFGGAVDKESKDPARVGMDASVFAKPVDEWAFTALERVFDSVTTQLQLDETNAQGYHLFGHSAGAQFVHRFLALVPPSDRRVISAACANAGWYTWPCVVRTFPYGLGGGVGTLLGVDDDELLSGYLAAPLHIFVGKTDTKTAKPLRQTREAKLQGKHRYARACNVFKAGRQKAKELELGGGDGAGFGWQCTEVQGVGHEGGKMARAAVSALFSEECSAVRMETADL